jgi:hypothetical protein
MSTRVTKHQNQKGEPDDSSGAVPQAHYTHQAQGALFEVQPDPQRTQRHCLLHCCGTNRASLLRCTNASMGERTWKVRETMRNNVMEERIIRGVGRPQLKLKSMAFLEREGKKK